MSLHPSLFALGVVLAVAVAGSGDYELVVPGVDAVICAKSRKVCDEARNAIRDGRWRIDGVSSGAPILCPPHPYCFPARSNCIEGYNCRD